MPNQKIEVAVYKGDEFLCMGTVKECAEFLGISVKTIYFYLSPAYGKRVDNRHRSKCPMIVERLEIDESIDVSTG